MTEDVLLIDDLVATASLDVKLLAGSQGLRRRVLWAHSCEMDDPTQSLGPDELLMTVGLCIPLEADKQVDFVAHIDDAGLAGLMIGDHDPAPPLSQAMLDEAERRSFPVLLAGVHTPYAVVARHVAAANWSTHSLQVMRLSQLYHVATHAEGGLDSLLGQLSSVLGIGLGIVDASYGIHIAEVELAHAPAAKLQQRKHRLRGTHAVDLVVAEPEGEPLDAFLLVHLLKMLEVATASVLNAADSRADTSRRVMRSLMNNAVPPEAEKLVHPHSASDGFQLAAFPTEDHSAVARVAALREAPIIVGVGRQCALALVPVPAVDLFRRIAGELGTRVGLSSTFVDYLDTRAAAAEATKVLAAAHSRTSWTEFEGSTLAVLTRSHQEAKEIVTGVLGPLAEETPKMDVLRQTLFTYLRNDRRWDATATDLGIHRQTLSYRLRRITEATGLDLARTADLSALWIASHAWQMLHNEMAPSIR